jgi:hypothetical protein
VKARVLGQPLLHGNQTSDGNGLTLAYNALQQTTSISSNGTTTNLAYLGEGQNELVTNGTTSLHNDSLEVVRDLVEL